MKAILKQIKTGQNKGRYRFELYGVNGEKMSTKQEYWDDEQELRNYVRDSYPNFTIHNSIPEEEEGQQEQQQKEQQEEQKKTKIAPKELQPRKEQARGEEGKKNQEKENSKKENDGNTDRGIL